MACRPVREVFLPSQFAGLACADAASRLGISANQVQKVMIEAMTHCCRASCGAFEPVL